MKSLIIAATAVGLALALPAYAGEVYYDFGTIGADGGPVCASDCVLAAGSHSFTGALGPVVATGINTGTGGAAYVTQKPGVFGTETGLGASLTYPDPMPSTDYEIAPGDALLTDWTGVTGNLLSVFIGSLQGPDTANIYAGATAGSLSLIGTATGTMDPQEFAVPPGTEFVEVVGLTSNGIPDDEDTLLIGGVVDVSGSVNPLGASVPEANTLALFGAMLIAGGLWYQGRNRVGGGTV